MLSETVLIYPVYAIMMGEHGISPIELSALFAIWSLSMVVFEVPSGTLADKVSRRNLLAVSRLVKGCAFPIWLMFPNFWGYAIGFMCWSLGGSLMSGTAESLLHDTLADHGKPEAFERIYGRGSAFKNLGTTLALATGGMIAETGFTTPLWLSAFAPWLSAVVIWRFIQEPPRTGTTSDTTSDEPNSDEPSYLNLLQSGFQETIRSKTLTTIAFAFAAMVAVYGSLEEYIGPFLAAKGEFSLTEIGMIYAAAIGLQIYSVSNAHRLGHQSIARICTVGALAAAILATTTALPGYSVALTLAVYFGVCAGAEILLQGHVQRAIEGRARATITSITGVITEVSAIAVYALVGGVATAYGWQTAITTIATVSAAAMALLWLRASLIDRAQKNARAMS